MGKRAKSEEIIAKQRELEVRLNKGESPVQSVRAIGVTEQRYLPAAVIPPHSLEAA